MPTKLTFKNHWLARYVAAVGAVGAGLLVRVGLTALAGEGLPIYITFYPVVMAVALLGGVGMGLVATLATVLAVDYWLLPPTHAFGIASVVDAVGLAFFAGTGVFMSVVAELYRRARQSVAAQETDLFRQEGQETARQPGVESVLLAGGLVLAMAILGTVGWQTYRDMAATAQAELWVSHTYIVDEGLEHLFATIQDMEASERGYLIMGQDDYLRPYEDARRSVAGQLDSLKRLTGDNRSQVQRLKGIEALVDTKLAELKEVIEVRRSQGLEAAHTLMARSKGQTVMEELRKRLTEAEEEEQRLLRLWTAARDADLRKTLQSLLGGGVFSLLLLTTVFVFLKQENSRRRRAEADLRRHEADLQKTVAARTADLSQAYGSLGEQREWLRITLSSIGDGVLATDTAGHITFLNPVAETLTGWEEKEALGQPVQAVFRVINEDTQGPAEDIIARVLREGRVIALADHTALVARDGSEVPIEDSAAPIRDSAGTVSGVVLVFHDVSEKQRTQAAMRESQRQNELLASVLERSSQPFGMGYPDGRLGLFNRAFEQLTGYSADELRAMDWTRTLTPPEWREIERRKLEELRATGQPVRYEKEYLRKDGTRVPIELLVHLARDAEGKPQYYYSFLIDITVRKQAEAALSASREDLRQRVIDLQAANAEVQASRRAALSLAEDAQAAREEAERANTGLQKANKLLDTSHRAALNLMDDAVQARKQAEQASVELRRASEQRGLALEAADLGTWDYHFQAGEVAWDERCRAMWGLPLCAQIDYAAAINQIHTEDRAGVDEAVKQALAGRDAGAYHREFRLLWPDGSVHWIASHGRVYFQGEGEQRRPIRFTGVNREITQEKQAEQALHESEERFRTMANAMPQLAWITRADGHIIWYNQRWYDYTGTTPEQMEGWGWQSVHDPAVLPKVLEQWRASLSAGEPFHMEFPLRGADGYFRPFLTRGVPLKDASGRVVNWFGTNTDISERKRREEELQRLNRTLQAHSKSDQALVHAKSEAQFMAAVCRIVVEDCGHAMVWIGFAGDDEGRTVRPAAQAGFEEGYLETLRITWADTELGRGPTGTAIRTGQPGRCDNMQTDPAFAPWRAGAIKRGYGSSLALPLLADGKAFGAMTIYSTQPDGFGEDEVALLTELAGDVAYGITEFRLRMAKERAEAARLESEARLAGLVGSAMDAILSVDAEQRVVLFNAAAEKMFGCPASSALGKPLDRFIPGHLRARHREHIQEFGSTGVSSRMMGSLGDLTALRADGQAFSIEASISRADVRGQKLFTVILRDITERKRAQAALQQTTEDLERSNRDLEQFAYVASHDLQEPLRAVGGYVKLLQLRFAEKLDAAALRYIAGAFEGATRMERLITDLLAFSRVGTRGGNFVPADLNVVLDQALRNLQTGIESARATITREPLPVLSVDGTQMMQLFQNLIGNALKFHAEAPPSIHIGAQQQDGRWVFSVCDNGIGIEPQYFERIFQIFQRLHTRKVYSGTGIGLAICKKIVERHGGTIWVESQPGQGSIFFFAIPAAGE